MSDSEFRVPTLEEMDQIVKELEKRPKIELDPAKSVTCPVCKAKGTDKKWKHIFLFHQEIGIGVNQMADCLACSECGVLFIPRERGE